jgi:hypothetical protein
MGDGSELLNPLRVNGQALVEAIYMKGALDEARILDNAVVRAHERHKNLQKAEDRHTEMREEIMIREVTF